MLGNYEPALLIVDDAPENRALLSRRFGRHGFRTTEATSGAQALNMLNEMPFALVLLDMMMPEMSGLEVLKKIRLQSDPMQLPVIMVTARADGSDVAEALEAGANDYITKPVDFAAALARVRAQLERKKANDTLREFNEVLEQRINERTADLVQANEQLKQEIAERVRSQAEIHYLAHHDSLTGIANRTLLRQQLQEALARPSGEGKAVAVLFVDLDGFKGINDSLGHSIGDGLLKSVALRLADNIRDEDRVARLGGDEFAIIQMVSEQPKAATILAERLIELMAQPYFVDGHELSIGASIGIAMASECNGSADEMLKNADLAMYRAKADGRGTYRFFEAEMHDRAQARLTMESALRTANLENTFEIYYQPLFDLAKKRVTCLEALLRWHHPDKGCISPSDFIPLAEEIKLIVNLGEWVLRRACMDAVNWPEDISVAINLSPVQFKYSGLPKAVRNALAASGLPARRLELEITESVLLERTDTSLAILNELRDLGVSISMDDFGTGYSSLSYLRSFRFDKVKIDKSFVADLPTGGNSLSIVRAIADLGRSFDMTVVAEGVETLEQLQCLENEGCSQVQGFLLSAALPASEIPGIIRTLADTSNSAISLLPTRRRTKPMRALGA